MRNQAAFDLRASVSGIASAKNPTQIISTPANSDHSGELRARRSSFAITRVARRSRQAASAAATCGR